MCETKILIVIVIIIVFASKSLQLTVHCEYKNSFTISNGRKMWKVVTNPYSCAIDNLEVISKLFVTNVTGIHVDEYTNNDVRALKIIGGKVLQSLQNTKREEIRSSCEIIPSGFGAVFSKIEALAITLANLKTVSSADLKQFSNLREIWLDSNHLEFLDSTLFQFNPSIEVLSFIANQIKYVGADFFDYLPKLGEAWFNYNWCINENADGNELNGLKQKIKEKCFTSEIRKSLDITVDCKYQISSDWEVVKDPYECNLLSLNITNKLVAVNATGRHLPGKWNNNVKAMTIYDGICHIIPSALGTIFLNIEALAVWNSSLQFVSSRDLQQFGNLREIWFLGNDLYLLESNLFKYNPRVEIVVVRSNKIKYVGGQFLDFLPNLRKTDFSDNECIDEVVTVAKKLIDFKDRLKEKCDVPRQEFSISTTIRPDGLLYWRWINVTIVDEDDGFGDTAGTDSN